MKEWPRPPTAYALRRSKLLVDLLALDVPLAVLQDVAVKWGLEPVTDYRLLVVCMAQHAQEHGHRELADWRGDEHDG
jgi:hypothetical protein